MKNNNNLNMVKKILLASILLLFLISYISAFCVVRGYVLGGQDESINATKINIVCKRFDGNILAQERNMIGYAFPFGNWYDDCSYCDLGVYINAIKEESNLYGETINNTCTSKKLKICHNNILMQTIPEPVSEQQYSNSIPDVGPYAPMPIEMPKGNISPNETVKGIKEDFYPDYTPYYVVGGIILLIITFLVIRKYAK